MLPAKMKGKAIPGNQMKKLLQYKTTDFINGFQGERENLQQLSIWKRTEV